MDGSVDDLQVALRRLARTAKGAAASCSAVADGWHECAIQAACLRAAVSGAAVPRSWEVEREAFLRRLLDE